MTLSFETFKNSRLSECHVANVTRIWLLSSVYSDVLCKCRAIVERIVASGAFVRGCNFVTVDMHLVGTFVAKNCSASFSFKFF